MSYIEFVKVDGLVMVTVTCCSGEHEAIHTMSKAEITELIELTEESDGNEK